MPNSAATQAEINERRTQLIKLRRKRVPYDDPQILNLGYSSAVCARKDFYRAVTARRKATEAEVADYREEQNEIYESLLDTYVPLANDQENPDHKAAEIVLKTLERMARTNGWEEILKAELSGPGGGPVRVSTETIAELTNLINVAGDPDPEDEDEDEGDLEPGADDNEDHSS